jgi:hypothetical protein
MPVYRVRRYKGADRPEIVFFTIEANDAQSAAEQVCGEPLIRGGHAGKLRATVVSPPPNSRTTAFHKELSFEAAGRKRYIKD